MEKFLEYNGVLFSSYEWAGGLSVHPNLNRKRMKLVKTNSAEIISNEKDFWRDSPKNKIERKK